MSSHCTRYPNKCNCSDYVGTKCDLKDDNPELFNRNEKNYPIDRNGQVDWGQTSIEKEKFLAKYESPSKKIRGSNYTPPKKKRKK